MRKKKEDECFEGLTIRLDGMKIGRGRKKNEKNMKKKRKEKK